MKKSFLAVLFLSFAADSVMALDIDFSRRRQKLMKDEHRPAMENADFGVVGEFLGVSSPSREVVILNTEKGFVPQTLRLEKDQKYTVYIVNVNDEKQNVSFVLDSYAQYHATYFGKMKRFEIRPSAEGVFSFQCPETSAEGRIVIYKGTPKSVNTRGLASEE